MAQASKMDGNILSLLKRRQVEYVTAKSIAVMDSMIWTMVVLP
jgi:hypothetical protein